MKLGNIAAKNLPAGPLAIASAFHNGCMRWRIVRMVDARPVPSEPSGLPCVLMIDVMADKRFRMMEDNRVYPLPVD